MYICKCYLLKWTLCSDMGTNLKWLLSAHKMVKYQAMARKWYFFKDLLKGKNVIWSEKGLKFSSFFPVYRDVTITFFLYLNIYEAWFILNSLKIIKKLATVYKYILQYQWKALKMFEVCQVYFYSALKSYAL